MIIKHYRCDKCGLNRAVDSSYGYAQDGYACSRKLDNGEYCSGVMWLVCSSVTKVE